MTRCAGTRTAPIPQRRTTRRRTPLPGTRVGPGGSRLGQDPHGRASHRLPHGRARRLSAADPGRDLHQQGGRRAQGTGGDAHRRARPRPVGRHLPRRLPTGAAQLRRTHRAESRLRHLRRRRPTRPPQGAVAAGAGAQGRQSPRPARHHRPRQVAPVVPRPARDRRGAGVRPHRCRRAAGARGGGVRALPVPARARQRRRFQRHPGAHRGAVRGPPRRARASPAAGRVRPRRRVPGHQPGSVPAHPPARRHLPQPDGGRRSRPEHLRLPGRRRAQHPRVPARLRGRRRVPPRAQLPIGGERAGGRQRRHPAQPGPAGEEPQAGQGSRRQGAPVPRGRPPRRGGFRRADRRAADGGARPAAAGHRHPVPDQRPVARSGGGSEAFRLARPHRGGRRLLRTPRGEGRAQLRTRGAQSIRRRLLAPHPQPAQARRRQDLRGQAGGLGRPPATALLRGTEARRRRP